jgi:hypothetical protein
MERVAIVYDCTAIDPSSCLPETEEENRGFIDVITENFMFIIVGVGLIGLIIVIFKQLRKRGPTIVAMLAVVVIGGGMLLPSGVVQAAKTTLWTFSGTTPFLNSYIYSNICVSGCGGGGGGGGGGGPIAQLSNTTLASKTPDESVAPTGQVAGTETAFKFVEIANLFPTSVTVQRGSNITDGLGNTLNDGATIPVGSQVLVVPRADQSTDITWIATGGSTDSPYGKWSNSTSQSCNGADFLNSNAGPYGTTHNHYVSLNVDPVVPTVSTGGTAGLNCNPSRTNCTVVSPGTINITVTWPATQGRYTYALQRSGFWSGPPDQDYVGTSACVTGTPFKNPADIPGGCSWNLNPFNDLSCFATTPNYSLPVASMSITHSISATAAPNTAPAAPTFTGPATAVAGNTVTLTVTGTDPDNDQIYYEFDWNNNVTTVEGRLPASTLVNSGISQFPTINQPAGTYTYHARTVDSKGARSGWTPYVITFTPAPALPTATFTINGSTGPVNVNPSDTLNLTWGSTNTVSCQLWGSDIPGGTTGIVLPSGSLSVVASPGGSDTYSVRCINGVGDSVMRFIVVNVANQGPGAPQINGTYGGVSSGNIGDSLSFAFRSVDPENDQVVYQIDWDNNGSGEDVSGPLASASNLSRSRSWPAPGTYVIRARATNVSGGQSSAWTTHTVTIGTPPPPTVTLQARVNGGGWSAGNQTVDPADSVELQWISTNATSSGCSALSGAGFTAFGTSGTDMVTTPAPTASDTFTVSCTGFGGMVTASITVTTRNRPNYSQPSILPTLSTGFDPITGEYDSVTIDFSTTNDGGSVADPSTAAQYRVRMDRNNDGYDAGPLTGAITDPLPVGAAHTGSVVFTNIPFGDAKVEVEVDTKTIPSYGRVREVGEVNTNNNANIRVYNFTGANAIPPPDPGLSISANPILVRTGETTTLTWDTVATYPGLSCTLVGPGGINENTLSGSKTTLVLTAKSVYTFTCTEATTNTVWTKSVAVDVTTEVEEI